MPIIAFTAMESKPLYRRDALNVLALPAGWNVRWSYRDVWIHDDHTFRDALESNRLADRRILLVLCGNADSKTQEFSVVIPVRWGTIISSRTSRDPAISHVSIRLGTFVSRNLVDLFTRGKVKVAIPRLDCGDYLLDGADDLIPQCTSGLSWSTVVDDVRRISSVESSLFFQLRGIRRRAASRPGAALRRIWSWLREARSTSTSISSHNLKIRPDSTGLNELNLLSGTLYALEIHVDADSLERNRTPVAITIQGSHLMISEPLTRQYGSDGVVLYLLAVQRKYATEVSTLTIRGSEASPAGPEIQMLLVMGPTRAFWPLTIIGLFLGWALTQVGAIPLMDGHPYWILVCRLFGAITLMVTAWFAFRRLPVIGPR